MIDHCAEHGIQFLRQLSNLYEIFDPIPTLGAIKCPILKMKIEAISIWDVGRDEFVKSFRFNSDRTQCT